VQNADVTADENPHFTHTQSVHTAKNPLQPSRLF